MNTKLLLWSAGSLVASSVLATLMVRPDTLEAAPIQRTIFLPGDTTDGHYQIELDCNACHGASFSDVEQIQEACETCHADELKRADDSHPQSKFTDPRNADRVESLDARWCVTCHQEHRPDLTTTMGLSLPGDYCYRCHADVGDERPTHRDLPFDSCADSGCHNFHDNRALYEDFLVEHRDEPVHLQVALVPARDPLRGAQASSPLTRDQHDAPGTVPELAHWVDDWEGTSHAQAGVNCTGCHEDEPGAWRAVPAIDRCGECHEGESQGFLAGRHGMRLAAALPAMTPGEARLPMHADAHDAELGCQSCHGAHDYDTRAAAADACLGCHADDHSRAWEASPHAALWRAEVEGRAAPGSGVSCATCHLPRTESGGRIAVTHNQNEFLRPGDKMIRSVCMQCHGLGFALDSLADPALIATNFTGRSARQVESIHFAAVLRWEREGRAPPWNRDPNHQEKQRTSP